MSSNNDNAMTRFLFAILRQKCLKDIDWNKVAHDPILAQEITNGHAARMRYSRFRSAMLGLEPQRRNRTTQNKAKVIKSKKETKAKKEEAVKPEPGGEPVSPELPANRDPSPRIKEEAKQTAVESQQPNPTFMTGPAMPDQHLQLQARLLTPCSDSDLLAASQAYAASPASDMLHSEASFDFTGPPPCGHEHAVWNHHSPAYSTFGVPYEFDAYSAGFCGHQPEHHHVDHFAVPTAMMSPDQVPVKHETWDSQYQ